MTTRWPLQAMSKSRESARTCNLRCVLVVVVVVVVVAVVVVLP